MNWFGGTRRVISLLVLLSLAIAGPMGVVSQPVNYAAVAPTASVSGGDPGRETSLSQTPASLIPTPAPRQAENGFILWLTRVDGMARLSATAHPRGEMPKHPDQSAAGAIFVTPGMRWFAAEVNETSLKSFHHSTGARIRSPPPLV